ncbi:hypothetical protein [uncultured Paludibaculum sp.]|uniref:hypothetical protein n=1 Tax=uncultured Paludibaculum sp. TaxID=1765020 RepID=UPI002AABBEA2|nr:hypothetical protein [uncultured Paludibaculum sp.]
MVTSKTGLAVAQRSAAHSGVKIRTVLTSDEEFEFGTDQWDLIAIIYPIEKRSAHARFECETNELPTISDGLRIIKYDDAMGEHEWERKQLRMVRLVAEKQRWSRRHPSGDRRIPMKDASREWRPRDLRVGGGWLVIDRAPTVYGCIRFSNWIWPA